MNNKGFMLTETLVFILMISILLISFYKFNIAFIDDQKKYKDYDNIEEIYKLANVRLFLYRSVGGINSAIEAMKQDDDPDKKTCISLNNVTIDGDISKTDLYKKMKEKFNIEQLWVCDFERSNPFNTDTNTDFKKYFEYTKTQYKDKYRMIARFTNNRYSSIKVWSVS